LKEVLKTSKSFFRKKIKTFHSFHAEVEYPGSCCVLLKQTFFAALTKLTSLKHWNILKENNVFVCRNKIKY
jgi:hypothetical protein